MKKITYSILVAALALVACNKETPQVTIPDDQKERISFSMSDGNGVGTKAGFTGSNTSIAMRIQSNEKGGSGVKYTRTVAEAVKDAAATPSAASYSTVSFGDAYTRYWDDAHGRKSLLSVFAVAIPNGGSSIQNNGKTLEQLLSKGDETNTWGTNADNTIEWVVSLAQEKDPSTATTPSKNIDKEDLVYANNIQDNATLGKDGVYRWSEADKDYKPDATGNTTHKNGQMLFFQNGMTDDDAKSKALTDAPGHFDKGHLKFNHALSRISVKLVAGTGFTKAATGSFDLSDDGVQFLTMNVKGKLNLPTGVWTADASAPTGTIVTKPTRQTTTDSESNVTSMYYETVAQMLPDYVIADGNNTNMLTFKFDGNEYFVTQNMIYNALAAVEGNKIADYGYTTEGGNKFKMMQGKNYKFEITINKKQIEAITATLKAWDDVSASFAQDNTHITITTSNTGSAHETELNLFKMEQTLDKIYTDDSYFSSAKGFAVFQGNYKASGVANMQEMKKSDNSSYTPKQWYADGWYYKDNKTAYHLRMLNNLAADENSSTDAKDDNVSNTASPEKSYFTMRNGAQTKDYHWGAPMIQTTSDDFLKYSLTEGYSSSIHPGFVAPKNYVEKPINITELHMMSNINVILKTTSTSNAINLRTGSEGSYNYATVKITKLASTATVDMGTGLVTPGTSITPSETMTRPTTYFKQKESPDSGDDITTTQPFTWAVVPQTLVREGGTGTENLVGITITTPDNNEYYVVAELSKIVPTNVGSQAGQMHTAGGENYITRWYPNHSYTYTFTITKKGIEAITCTLADWVTVDGGNTNIDLES